LYANASNHENVWGSGGKAPPINLSIRWKWAISVVECSSLVLERFCVRSQPFSITIHKSASHLKTEYSQIPKSRTHQYTSMDNKVSNIVSVMNQLLSQTFRAAVTQSPAVFFLFHASLCHIMKS
jgi:hypothetical protein